MIVDLLALAFQLVGGWHVGLWLGRLVWRIPWVRRRVCPHASITVVIDPSLGLGYETCDDCGRPKWHEAGGPR